MHPLRRRRRRDRAQRRRPTTAPGSSSWDLGCDGSATGLLEIPAGGSRRPTTAETVADGEHYLKMAGPEVFRRAVRIVVESATTALDRAGVTVDDVTWFVPHQANVRIIEAAGNRLGIPAERTLVNIDRYGNTERGVDPARARRGRRRRSARATATSCCSPASAPA